MVGEEAFVSEEGASRQSGYSSSKRAMTRNSVSSKKSNFPGDNVSIHENGDVICVHTIVYLIHLSPGGFLEGRLYPLFDFPCSIEKGLGHVIRSPKVAILCWPIKPWRERYFVGMGFIAQAYT